jgi:hypothetical protein
MNVSYSEWSETRGCFIAIAFKLCFRMKVQETREGLKFNEHIFFISVLMMLI